MIRWAKSGIVGQNGSVRQSPSYGGRGIYVCDEWKEKIEDFIKWAITNGYEEGLTLERNDNNGPYSPSNCKWIPNSKQALNTRRIRHLTFNGETLSISAWSRKTGIHVQTILGRLRRNWDLEQIFTTDPVIGRNQYD